MARELFSLPPLSRLSFSLLPLSYYFPSAPSLSFPLHLLPLLFLSTYTRTIYFTLPLPSPAYSLSSTFYPYSFYLPIPAPSTSLFHTLPILSPPPSDERDEGYPILPYGKEGGGAGDSHIPLIPPRGKSEGRDRNKKNEATYPLWGTSPRVYLWGRVRTWGSGGYFFAFFIPSR